MTIIRRSYFNKDFISFLPLSSKALPVALVILAIFCVSYSLRSIFSKKEDTSKSPNPQIDHPSEKDFETAFQARAFIVIGACGSGKSTLVDQVYKRIYGDATIIDADLSKEQVPEYKEWIKTKDPALGKKVHGESLKKRTELFNETVAALKDLIFLGTGADYDFYKDTCIGSLVQAGYHVTMICVQTDLDKAIKRCANRALDKGRPVPDKAIQNSHTKAYQNFELYKSLVHDWKLYDNNEQEFKIIQQKEHTTCH